MDAVDTLETLEGIKILVVDDDPDSRFLLSLILTHAGGVVETAASAAEALATLARFRPALLVSDIMMPGDDGISLIEKVRLLEPGLGLRIAAVAVSALPRPEDEQRALAAGFQAYVRKPIEPEMILDAILKAHPEPQSPEPPHV